MSKRMCGCASAVGHLPNCPLKNQGVRADFSDLIKIIREARKKIKKRSHAQYDADFKKLLRDVRKLIQNYRDAKARIKNKTP